MKRILIFTAIIFSIPVLSFVGFYSLREIALKQKNATELIKILPTAEVEEVKYCDLVANPEKYDGRTVRLQSTLYFGLEGAFFTDDTCGVNFAAIAESYDKEIWKTIRKARDRADEEYMRNEIVLAVRGRFFNKTFNNGGLITPFRFEILKIEQVIETPQKTQ